MRTLSRASLGLILLVLLAPASHAQLTKIFVASYGNDANDGSRGSPKRNFQPAHDAVAPGGQIVVLDTAGYGPLNITKSMSVTVPPGINGFITVTGSATGVHVTAGSSGLVTLRGLIIEGGASTGNGIFTDSVDVLRVENCTIRNFAVGIYVYNANGGRLVARECAIRDVQTGIQVRSASANFTVTGTATNCTVDNATESNFGGAFYVETNAANGITKLTLSGCVATNSFNGLKAYGAGSTLYADTCVVSGNNNGIVAANGANAQSRVNNVFTGNGTDGSFPGGQLAAK